MSIRLTIAGFLLALGSCTQPGPPPPSGPPKFDVGNPFLSNGEWEYPQNFASYDTTGLSMVLNEPKGAISADNEAYDPGALQAASAVLQLPAIAVGASFDFIFTACELDVAPNENRVVIIGPRAL